MKISREQMLVSIRATPFFAPLKDDEAAVGFLADRLRPRHFEAGEPLVREGETGDELFIIHMGTARVVKKTLAGEDYTVVTLTHQEHACIGELALFDSEVRSATAIAEGPCDVLLLSRKEFEEFTKQFPIHSIAIYRQIISVLSQRLRKASQDIITLFEALVHEIEEDGAAV